MPQPRCSPPICQRSAARQSRAGAVLPRGAAQTEPSPRSRSGGSDYCGAQELTAASCGNYCCDGEAAAALHRARRHGVRPRGGSAWSPGGRTDGEEGKRGLGGARAALGSRPGVARFQPHILLVLYRGCVLQLCTVSEKGMLGSAVLCPFRFGEPTYCPAWRHLTARGCWGRGGTARSCSRPSPIRAISTAHLPPASDPKAHPYSFGLICAPSPAGSFLPVCLHKDVRRKRSAPLGPALEHVCSKRLYRHRWGGIACPALLCSRVAVFAGLPALPFSIPCPHPVLHRAGPFAAGSEVTPQVFEAKQSP